MAPSNFRNAIRIRRTDSSTSAATELSRQDAQDLEMRAVRRAVADEDEENLRDERNQQAVAGAPSGSNVAVNPPPRGSSLLERMVKQDLAGSKKSHTAEHRDKSTSPVIPPPPPTQRGTGAMDRMVRELDILEEAPDEPSPSVASPSSSTTAGAAYFRPDNPRSRPTQDKLRGLAPGPRLPVPLSQEDAQSGTPMYQGGAASSRSFSTPTTSNLDRGMNRSTSLLIEQNSRAVAPRQDPDQGHVEPDSSADPRDQGGEQSKDGLFSSIMRRGRSFTLPGRRPVQDEDSWQNRQRKTQEQKQPNEYATDDGDSELHEDGVVDYLDVVDPEVGVLNHMSNIQNSIFLPSFSGFYDRRITHELPKMPGPGRRNSASEVAQEEGRAGRSSPTALRGSSPTTNKGGQPVKPALLHRVSSAITLGRKKAADPPQHIDVWHGMDDEQRHELDIHVEHLLSRPQRFRRGFRGFLKWARTPIGFIMLCYGLAITGWGIAICLFIFDWTTVRDAHQRRLWIEYCDQVLCALFAAVGLGFAPFRAMDTWRMIHIAHFHHLSWNRRRQFSLPKLNDPNDLPRPKGYNEAFPEAEDRTAHEKNTGRHSSRRGLLHQEGAETGRSRQTSPSHSSGEHQELGAGSDTPHVRGSDSPLPAAPLPQALSNAKADTARPKKWWHLTSRKEKEERKHAAEAALKHAEDVGRQRAASGRADRPLARTASVLSEELVKVKEDVVVLTPEEQAKLSHHQRMFHRSHHYYRYHETATHHAFPLDLLIVIVCLLDCHSLLQGCLGGVTWGISYRHRPTALTATLISCSLSCNAVAGFIIYLGGRRTKKVEETKRRLRIAMETEAYERIQAGEEVPVSIRTRKARNGDSTSQLPQSRSRLSSVSEQASKASEEKPLSQHHVPSLEAMNSFTATSSRTGPSSLSTTPLREHSASVSDPYV